MKYAIALYVIWNIITFSMMGIDKYKAKNNKWRISEATLLITAIFMGGIGSLTGSKFFRHKTQKIKFKILLPFSVLLNLSVIVYIYYRITMIH
ncbi:DUF1294 domain-containing protein [Aminipila terrae]|uniref:DUF1294 domain-containing protein n=1 Tax=Aminipila terrae TaxID=2697030 RepID=A0A6P1ME19_9FIRM|nr:DUF1294 domain-containing protein [Aminipila terrae]QHI72272.1 DUF1294 domain-containing protein [Aminipila terrae]